MNFDFLRRIGLSEGEIKVYEALLMSGSSGMSVIQQKTGMERRNIYDILNKLIDKGIATYIDEKRKRKFQLTHPEKLVSYLEEKKKEIQNVEEDTKSHIPDLTKIFNESKEKIRAEVYRGNESIKALLEEALSFPENYWLGGNGALDTYFPYWWKHFDKKRIEKKVMWYDLADYGLYLSEYKKNELYKSKYYELRFLPPDLKSPMVIFIFGNKVAQIVFGKQSFAFVLESKDIKESFMRYFKHFWKKVK